MPWICHFVSTLNSWNEESKLLWLKFGLTEGA